MRIVVALLVLTTLITFYIINYRLNRKQILPEGFEGAHKSCGSCDGTSCGLHSEKEG